MGYKHHVPILIPL